MSDANVMIVEDKKIVAMDIQNSLETLGYRVCGSASSGEEAVHKAQEIKPDLVLMDIMLDGEMDGIEAATEIRSRLDIPVIYLTAYTDEDTLNQAMRTEPHGYLVKPFEERELGTTIETALYKHKMEARLKEHQKWLATTLDSIGDAVIATDARGNVKLVNPVAEKLIGYTQESILGEKLGAVFFMVDAKSRTPREDPFERVIKTVKTLNLPKNSILISRDGSERFIEGNMAPIAGAGDRIMGTVLVFRDLTERHRLQEELLKAQKLETLEAFAGGVAQNFNNVLTTALGYISLAQLNSQEPEGLGKKLEKAKQSCLLGKELSEQFLTFSQGNSPIKETVFISKVIRDSADFVMKGSPVHCHINIPEDLWPIEIDKKQMRLAIRNLINSARRATPEGGTVHVYVTNVTVLPAHRLSIAPGKYVKVSIQDEGPSPSQEALQKMMDPSVMVKEGAHGLEMATACSIIYGHDGCLTAESRAEPGKILHIYLPASEKETVENKYLEGCFPVGKGKVLLLDRQEMVRDAVGRVLHNLGYEVLAASSGAEAVELYRNALQSGEPFDVVIIDTTASPSPDEMRFEEALRELKEIDHEVRIVLSSTHPGSPLGPSFESFGFNGLVAKPYQVEELQETLYKVIMQG